MDITKAILSLRPGASWSISGDDYETLWWSDENELPPPTEEEINQEIERLQAEYEYNQYQRLRAREYPDFKEYLDGLVKRDTEQMQVYIDACLAVKAKYPKPEGVE